MSADKKKIRAHVERQALLSKPEQMLEDALLRLASARTTIAEAGAELEQTLCNLGLIEEKTSGRFVNRLKRRAETAPAKGGAHG